MLRDVLIVISCYAEIENDVQQERKVKERVIKSVRLRADGKLHIPVNAQQPERLDEQIQCNDQRKVGNKFPLHAFHGGRS